MKKLFLAAVIIVLFGVPALASGPLIGYEFYFVALDQDQSAVVDHSFQSEFTADAEHAGEGSWELVFDQELLTTGFKDQFGFASILGGTADHSDSRFLYSAWMVTMAEQPLTISLNEKHFTKSEEAPNFLLDLTLTPVRIDTYNQWIETEVDLEFIDLAGYTAGADITAQLLEKPSAPLAVVTRRVNGQKGSDVQYFALYAAASLLTAEMLPKDAAVVPMGDLSQLGLLFAAEPAQSKQRAEIVVLGSFSETELGFDLALNLPVTDLNELYGGLGFRDDWYFLVGSKLGVDRELGFIVQLAKQGQEQPVLQLGMADAIDYSRITLGLQVLPVEFDLVGLDFRLNPRLIWEIAYQAAEWSVRYLGHLAQANLDHEVELACAVDESADAVAAVRFNRAGINAVAFGLRFSF